MAQHIPTPTAPAGAPLVAARPARSAGASPLRPAAPGSLSSPAPAAPASPAPSIPAAAPQGPGGRIGALDMLRGYALVCIMLNHMPHGQLRGLTVSNFFLFDAAELFVLLSGTLVGLVWERIAARAGTRAAQRRFLGRAVQVWRALVLAAVLLALLSAALQAMGLTHSVIWHGYAGMLLDRPVFYLTAVASIWLQPNLLDVLALYTVLLAAAPLVMPALARWPLRITAVLGVVWWFAVPLNLLLPNERPNETGLLFNPFGWQALFFAGAGLALHRARLMPLLRRHGGAVTALALGVLVFGWLVLIGWRVGEPLAPLRNALFAVHGVIEKWHLDAVRVLSILAAGWMVVGPLAAPMARLASTPPGAALATIGRGGLVSFVGCVLLSITGDAVQTDLRGHPAALLAVDLWTIAALWLLAAALSRIEAARTAA